MLSFCLLHHLPLMTYKQLKPISGPTTRRMLKDTLRLSKILTQLMSRNKKRVPLVMRTKLTKNRLQKKTRSKKKQLQRQRNRPRLAHCPNSSTAETRMANTKTTKNSFTIGTRSTTSSKAIKLYSTESTKIFQRTTSFSLSRLSCFKYQSPAWQTLTRSAIRIDILILLHLINLTLRLTTQISERAREDSTPVHRT